MVERDVWKLAVTLIERHGTAAPAIFRERMPAEDAITTDELAEHDWILYALHELLRSRREAEEWVN